MRFVTLLPRFLRNLLTAGVFAGLLCAGTMATVQIATPAPDSTKRVSEKAGRKSGRSKDVGVASYDSTDDVSPVRTREDLGRLVNNPQVDVIAVRGGSDVDRELKALPKGWDHWRPENEEAALAWRKEAVPDLPARVRAEVHKKTRRDAKEQRRSARPERQHVDHDAGYSTWPADASLPLRPLVVDGMAFDPGIIDDDDVYEVLHYVAEQYDARVEPLTNSGNWGYSYRANRNDPSSMSTHASGTAIDINAGLHPNGVSTASTFSEAQIAEVHKILDEVDSTVRWGGDYHSVPDAMHFEIVADKATVGAVADRLRRESQPKTPLPKSEKGMLTLMRQAIADERVVDVNHVQRHRPARLTRA